MREIEVKAKLKNKEEIVKKLTALGCVFEPVVTQSDTVYSRKIGKLETFLSNDVFARLRVKNGKKVLFTVKKNIGKGGQLDKLEYEVEVSSRDEMEQALWLMDYKEAVKVNKTRVITHYNDCEICIDDVEGLGSFIEMEKLVEDGDSEMISKELFDFLESLGVDRKDRVTVGYDILIFQKMEGKLL